MNSNKKMHLGLFIALLVLLIVSLVIIIRFVMYVDYDNLSGHFLEDMENMGFPIDKEIESHIENEYSDYYYGSN